MTRISILIFDEVEELDFAGPYEVLSAARELGGKEEVTLVAETLRPVRCANGLSVEPHATLGSSPPPDVLMVPGGRGARMQSSNASLLDWVKKTAASAAWVTSVCTGALLLADAGLLEGKRVTTHWAFIEQLRERKGTTVLEGVRYVRDGNLVTAAGVSAGIDMTLWLVGVLHDPDFARQVQKWIDYQPAPPWAAEA
jgi:transcriptional regulator GlxA family with amidase domain